MKYKITTIALSVDEVEADGYRIDDEILTLYNNNKHMLQIKVRSYNKNEWKSIYTIEEE